MTARHEPFSPTWWALWAWELTRPGLYDDEEPPAGYVAPRRGDEWHGREWDRRESVSPYDPTARRPAWTAFVAGQSSTDPTPTDGCRLHDGRCSGSCARGAP